MVVVDIYGAPCSGKSVAAAYVFAQLKMRGISCELVTEAAKDLVWDGNLKALHNQAYVFGCQYYKLSRLEDEVDVVVTDSPLLLSNLYCNDGRLGQDFKNTVAGVAKSFICLSYFLKPFSSKHDNAGRIHSKDESMKLSDGIEKLLHANSIEFKALEHDEASYACMIDDVVKELKR